MVEKAVKAMVAGHICLDITPVFNPDMQGDFGELLSPGKLINVGRAVFSTGGAVSNTGLAMKKLGVDVLLNGKVGTDEIGGLIKTLVGPEGGVALRMVNGQNSSYSIVLTLPGVDRIFLHDPGTNDTFTADDIDYDALADCELFHFGYPTLMRQFYINQGAELVQMYKRVKETGVVTCLDMTLPDPNSESGRLDWKLLLKDVLPYVDIFMPSVEEIAFMIDREMYEQRKSQSGSEDPVLAYTGEDLSALSSRMLDMGVKIAMIKAGIRGNYVRTASRESMQTLSPLADQLNTWAGREVWANSYKAETFGSATGAGDATIAGFLTALLRGHPLSETIRCANILGWQNVRQMDALSGIEDWQATLGMMADNAKERNPLEITDAGWAYSETEQIYVGPADKR